jgi:Domain of unknown function (DUF5666)
MAMPRTSQRSILVLVLLSAYACGGGNSTPTAPTMPAASTTSGGGNSTSGAVVNGIVASASTTSSLHGLHLTDVAGVQRVEVVGTTLSSPIDAQGAFSLVGVPAGAAQLKFSGTGANATVTVSVDPNQTISVIVTVSGTSAAIVSDSRNPDAGQLPVNGNVVGLTGSGAAFQFTVNALTIHGDNQTQFYGDGSQSDSFLDLKEGMRVEVKATPRDGGLYAFRLHLNKNNSTDSGSGSDGGNGGGTAPPGQQDDSASIEGTLTSMGGSIPNLTLVVAGVTVRTSAATDVQRRGDKQDLSTIKLGQTLHVIGVRQSNGSIDARQIQIKDDTTGGAFQIEGSVGGLKGSCPSVTFGVNGYAIATDGSTTFSGVICSALKNGDNVTVNGVTQSNGSVLATTVKKG